MKWSFAGAGLVALSALMGACGDDAGVGGSGGGVGAATTGGSGGGGGATTGAGGSGGAAETDWFTCPGAPGIFTECATLQVPLDWDDPEGEKIPYFVKRLLAESQPARGQVWLLQGGPGADGSSIVGLATFFREVAPDLDIYVPDHRGVGLSAQLDCAQLDFVNARYVVPDVDAAAAAAPSCVEEVSTWGDGLAHFSSTDAARDVGELIETSLGPDQVAFVYGVSYGTRWAHRYLQQFPDQAAGVILDSIVTEDMDYTRYDVGFDRVARQILEACGEDAFCSAELGPDPVATAEALLEQLAGGWCPTTRSLDVRDYQALFAFLLVGDPSIQTLLPALLRRIQRCDPDDAAAIGALYDISAAQAADPFFASGLFFNVTFSELFDATPPTVEAIESETEPFLAASWTVGPNLPVRALWTTYDPGPHAGAYADTETPLLMLNGANDAQTPLDGAAAFASHYDAAGQTFVALPNTGHSASISSPTADGPCGMDLIGQFLDDPTAALDTSCLEAILVPDFEKADLPFPGTSQPTWVDDGGGGAGGGAGGGGGAAGTGGAGGAP